MLVVLHWVESQESQGRKAFVFLYVLNTFINRRCQYVDKVHSFKVKRISEEWVGEKFKPRVITSLVSIDLFRNNSFS